MNSIPHPTRRSILSGVGLAAAGAAAAALPLHHAEAEAIELTMVTAWPKNTPGVGVNAQRFADRLQAMSGGRLVVHLYAAGELVPGFEALDALTSGTADMAHSTPYYWVGKAPALNYFTGVPFGFTALELYSWLRFGGGQELWEEVYAPFGVVPFYAGSSGAQAGGWFNRLIETVDDFKGLKFRIAGLGAEVMRRLGATTVTTPPGEIATSLGSGAVDGADWVGPWNDIAFGLNRFAKYYYMPGFAEPGPSLEVIITKARYDALPVDLKAVLRAAAEATALETIADFTFHNIEAYESMLREQGVDVRRFPDAVVDKLAEVTAAVLEDLAASDPLSGKVDQSFRAFLAKARAYAPAAEEGFLAMRSRG
jgi:TRAP-type mannitol/chloroaromatic compound transport system substrate-binding protein